MYPVCLGRKIAVKKSATEVPGVGLLNRRTRSFSTLKFLTIHHVFFTRSENAHGVFIISSFFFLIRVTLYWVCSVAQPFLRFPLPATLLSNLLRDSTSLLATSFYHKRDCSRYICRCMRNNGFWFRQAQRDGYNFPLWTECNTFCFWNCTFCLLFIFILYSSIFSSFTYPNFFVIYFFLKWCFLSSVFLNGHSSVRYIIVGRNNLILYNCVFNDFRRLHYEITKDNHNDQKRFGNKSMWDTRFL